MKMYPQLTREYIRDGISYVNLVMLQNVIPPYRTKDSKDSKIQKFNDSKTSKGKPIPRTLAQVKHVDDILMGFG